MGEFNPGRSKPWNNCSGLNAGPTQKFSFGGEGSWTSFGSSMNAFSLGFMATAILISMFLIMAVFEHLFRPSNVFSREESSGMESRQRHKLGTPEIVQMTYASGFSVVMPGQQYATFLAQPAPLPCQREGVYWPSHQQSNLVA